MTRQPDEAGWRLTALALAAALWSGTSVAEVRAFFDQPTVYEGDNVTLTIEAEGIESRGEPDLEALGQDFDLLGTSTGSEIRIVNGQRSDKRTWRVSLAPKSLGKIELPPIQVGGDRTGPLTLTVSEVPQGAQGGPGDDVYLEAELGIDGDSVMVQQQVPLVVRLYSALRIRGGALSDPRAEGAIVERLGNDKQYRTSRNGRDYRVIERRFSLSPERSGELRIAPVVFEGEVQAPQDGNPRGLLGNDRLDPLFRHPLMENLFNDSAFSMFERGKPVRAQAQGIRLHVEPRPAGFGGEDWLPAEAVAIDDSWATQPPRLRAGEPATRTLTITAKGLAGTQIPEVEIPVPRGLRAYPEQTETQSRTDGATLYAVSIQRLAVIPTAGGRVEIPEIRVPWWDTVAETERVATVPAMTLEVAGPAVPDTADSAPVAALDQPPGATESMGSDGDANAGALAAGSEGNPVARVDGSDAETTPESAGSARLPRSGIGQSLVLPLLLTVLLLAAVAGLLLYRRRATGTLRPIPRDPSPARSLSPKRRLASLRDTMHRACIDNDAAAAARAILAWAQAAWPEHPPANLAAIAERLQQRTPAKERTAAQVRALERHLYAPDAGPWNGEPLWRVLEKGIGPDSPRQQTDDQDLEPFYPRRA